MKKADDEQAGGSTLQILQDLFHKRNISWDPQFYLDEIHRWAREQEALGKPDVTASWTLENLLSFETGRERECYLNYVGCGERRCPVCKGDGFVGHDSQGQCDPSLRCNVCMPTLGFRFIPEPGE